MFFLWFHKKDIPIAEYIVVMIPNNKTNAGPL